MKKAFLPGVTRKEGTPPPAELVRGRWGVALSGRTPGKKLANKQPQKVYENLGGPLRLILTALLIFLASQIIAAFIAELGLSLIHPHGGMSLDDSIGAQFVYVALAEGLAAWLVIRTVRRRGLNLGFIGLGRRPVRGDLGRALIGFGIFYLLLILAGVIVNWLSPDLTNQKQNLGFTNIHTGSDNILAFMALVLLPPLGEEILVRGYLYSGLRKIWRFAPALLATSFIFGAAHLEIGNGSPLVWGAALDTFLLSVVLVYLREKTGALYAGMLVHMLNNLIAFFVVIK
jgi:membrane protease YdiL (CAAX protease family)